MRIRTNLPLVALVMIAASEAVRAQTSLGTDFTYQGQLKASGMPAIATADFKYSLFNDLAFGAQIGATLSKNNVGVVNGLFTLPLDFGAGAFNGEARWIEVAVRSPAGAGTFATLTPRLPVTAAPYALQTRGMFVDAAGKVGIGTTTPTHTIHIAAPEPTLALQDTDSTTQQVGYVSYRDSASSERAWVGYGTAGSPHFSVVNNRFNGDIQILPGPGGRVGINTLGPLAQLHVKGSPPPGGSLALEGTNDTFISFYPNGAAQGRKAYVGFPGFSPFIDFQIANETLNGNIDLVTFGTGATRVKVLEIMGADVAEKFPASEKLEPGMVVAIDPKNPGKLCLARGVYNRRVAGVVSGANNFSVGAILGSAPENKDAPAIALSGRVYVRCDVTNSAIEPGDLLTTADLPGHAMKVTDFSRAQGAIIGKAMTGLGRGETGMVLVLVSLQ